MKQILLLLSIGLFIVGCGGSSSEASGEQKPKPKSMLAKKEPASDKGIGVVTHIAECPD